MRIDTYSFMLGWMTAKANVDFLADGKIHPLTPLEELTYRNLQGWDGLLNEKAVPFEDGFGIDNKRKLYQFVEGDIWKQIK